MAKFTIAALCIAFFFCSGQSPVEAQTNTLSKLLADITLLSQNIAELTSMVPELCNAVVKIGIQTQKQIIQTVNDMLSKTIQQADNLIATSGVDTSSCPNVTSALTPDAESIKSSLTACTNNAIFAAQLLNNSLMTTYAGYAVTLTNIQSLTNSCSSFWQNNLDFYLIEPRTLLTALVNTMTANGDIIIVGSESFNYFSSQLCSMASCTTTSISQITAFQAEITPVMQNLQQYIMSLKGTVS